MNFGLTEDQELLREQAVRFVEQRCAMPQVREWSRSERGYDAACFAELAGLGWTGLLIPEADGGAGLGWVEACILLEATGGALLPGPLASTLVASAAIVQYGSASQRARYLPQLASGAQVATVALLEGDGGLAPSDVALAAQTDGQELCVRGQKDHVHDVDGADLFVTALRTPDGLALAVLERELSGLRSERQLLIDSTKRVGTLHLEDVRVPRDAILVVGAAAEAAFTRVFDLGAVATTAEMVGAADAVHRLTVDYAKARNQFGRPIGQYQGVKHPLAEMYVDIQTFRSLLYYAAWVADGEPASLSRSVSMAKAYASDAFARIGIDAIQLHGAIGYTAEYDAQLYLKRSKFARPAFGDADYHYERVARLGGLADGL